MTAPLLSTRALNRTLLARQLLLERASMPVADALDYLVGLQAQVPGSPYVALHARLADFDPLELSGLIESHEAVRTVLMRGTIHLVTADDAARLRPVVQPVLDRELFVNRTWARGLTGVALAPVLAYGRELVEERPRSMSELRTAIAERWPELDAASLAYAIRGRLPTVQATPRGLWGRSGGVTLTTLEHWTGRSLATETSPDAAIMRYLLAFGPATVADASAWCGLTGLREVFERLRPALRTFRDERGRELFDHPDGVLVDADVPARARFLPDYDNALLSHRDRSRILPPLEWPELGDNVTAPRSSSTGSSPGSGGSRERGRMPPSSCARWCR